MLRAKFRLESITYVKDLAGETVLEQVKLSAVHSDDPESENAQWSRYTPNGHLEMDINNPAAFGHLSNGHEFYVDLIPVED